MEKFKKLLHHESAPGVLLMLSAILAMICANSGLHEWYNGLINTNLGLFYSEGHGHGHVTTIDVGHMKETGNIIKSVSLQHWINDGLMAVFFFQVGLELKREMVEGELSNPSQLVLPGLAAFGGVLVPALIFAAFNWDDKTAMNGWAIPTATDIAFSLGVLSLLGKRVPSGLKIFLLSLAIIDDLAGILIIAFFYTSEISTVSLVVAFVIMFILFMMNRKGIYYITPYLLVGFVLWIAFLKSGVHATLAGVILAFFIPIAVKNKPKYFSPLKRLEKDLHPAVVFWILPIFAFANTGIDLSGLMEAGEVNWGFIFNEVTLGIFCGLIIGKIVGVFSFSFIVVKFKLASLPTGAGWLHILGLSMLCGIGFTMSLFISGLAYQEQGDLLVQCRIGILVGSIVAAVLGFSLLKFLSGRTDPEEIEEA